MSFSYRLHAVFICFVPNTGKRIIILGVSVAMRGRQGSTTPDHGIRGLGTEIDGQESVVVQIAMEVPADCFVLLVACWDLLKLEMEKKIGKTETQKIK